MNENDLPARKASASFMQTVILHLDTCGNLSAELMREQSIARIVKHP
jgi:hypothetical protein